jgi:hypothetical protein
MLVIVGEEGCSESFQEEFPTRIQCVHCGLTAHIAFVAVDGYDKHGIENGKTMQVWELYNERKGEDFKWLHDSASFATYICSDCLKATTILNQA